jgi:hypothetical protein
MALHYMKLRCEAGHLRSVRRPTNPILLCRIVAHSKCHVCMPEFLALICGACLVPFSVVTHHAHGLCGVCVRREFYRNLPSERLAAVRAEEMLRMRERRALQTPAG